MSFPPAQTPNNGPPGPPGLPSHGATPSVGRSPLPRVDPPLWPPPAALGPRRCRSACSSLRWPPQDGGLWRLVKTMAEMEEFTMKHGKCKNPKSYEDG